MIHTLDMNEQGTQHFLFKLQPGNSLKARKLYQETYPHRQLKSDQTFTLMIVSRKIQKLQSSGQTHTHTHTYIYIYGITIPLQALTGTESSRRLRLPDFKTIGT